MRLSTHRIPGMVLTAHQFSVPVAYDEPDGPRLTVFARDVVAPGQEDAALPWLVFMQGGPGFGSPRPFEPSDWLKPALQHYRVLLLDQRGTGLSTPVTYQTLAGLDGPQAQAAYLKHFRADNIVRDAELIRRELLGPDEPWYALGQSYGGFVLCCYLSLAPAGLAGAMFTGGLPSLERGVDDVYRATYRRVLAKNRLYYDRYPQDAERVAAIVSYLQTHDVSLPGGGRLTPRRFQQLGFPFGASDGFERVHYLLEEAFVAGAQGREIAYGFLRGVENLQNFETNPIYALLHEPIYCQGQASNWSAERVRREYPEFDLDGEGPVYFTGEMIYPWMFDDYARLQPLKEAAAILAAYDAWPQLYDVGQLRGNEVPCAAVVYYDDMYVERAFSEETAATMPRLKIWVTNEFEHNGLRQDGTRLFNRLRGMLRGEY